MRTISWILLTILSVLIVLGSLSSLSIAYFGAASSDIISGSTSLQDLQVSPQVAKALRGRRGTAAAFALGFGTMLLFVILGPYRKRAGWAWWAVLVSILAISVVILIRIVALSIVQGGFTALVILLVAIPALILDVAGRGSGKGRDVVETPKPPHVSEGP
jgi:hypothetical protein